MRARGPAPGAPKGAPGAGAGPGIGEGANTVKEGGAWTAWNGAVLLGAGLAASAVACYALDERLQDEVGVEPVYVLMAGIGAWIVFLELATASLSNFASRKLCHAGCGLGMLAFDYRDTRAKLFVWAVAVSSTLMTWGLSPLPPFRFAQMRDVGVTIYLSVVAAWFFFELPTPVLAPVFFADPAGAVVGKFCSRRAPAWNPQWYREKTVAGSLAVAAFTFATLGYPCTLPVRCAVATLAMLAEAVGDKYDNLALATVVLAGWAFASDELSADVDVDAASMHVASA